MNKIVYIEGSGGISGDMTVAALLDLGAKREKLDAVLGSLHLDGLAYEITRKTSYGLTGCDFNVIMEHHHQHHRHRNLQDVLEIIDRGAMTASARMLAKKIFQIVADAEAMAHGCPVNDIHFHEVGAIDSIADIVAAAVLWDDLQCGKCIVSGLTEGKGTVRCAHGELPVPVPAVANIVKQYGIQLRISDVEGERITPTGAAIAAAVRTQSALPQRYRISGIGCGLGKRDFGCPNILRIMLLDAEEQPVRDSVILLESNIDDSTGETLGFAMEKLMAAGALDVHYLPCFMKKNRPAYLLRIIAESSMVPLLEQVVFETTSTIGIRKMEFERSRMSRTIVPFSLSCGEIMIKRCVFGETVRLYPEYESLKKLAESSGVPFAVINQIAMKELANAGK